MKKIERKLEGNINPIVQWMHDFLMTKEHPNEAEWDKLYAPYDYHQSLKKYALYVNKVSSK